ncbi:methylenetetrahydrofolate reductase-domain-containing protein [Tricharina praecox]|uniref:methylenetetrahydrofolate reductase-domain-containing protein n=1 Tax=Tricharina praecox TaxID=43433 RepID=UPI00221FE557|nr:methylenetetrahydrofolate reductase-domain-containing protein [Tricharina praecox]KAI5854378.1 methylenetetrahydrofolate reductase-domain-containing protein [Tricharina praecox]
MQKITDKIAALPPGDVYHSLEFFPPKTEMGLQNLTARLERMALALRPLFVTVTWGAGGSTATKSLQLAEICQSHLNLTTCLHLTCTNMSKKTLDEALESAKEIGIRNILALRGDPPRHDEYFNPATDEKQGENEAERREFVWAIDLVRYIREKYGDYFCIGVAAYPEGYAEGTCPEHQDPVHDLPYLIDKVKAGADFLMTQLFYGVDKYVAFEKMLREDPSGVFADMVIVPGLMPIQSYSILRRTTKLSNASLPQSLQDRLEKVKGDDAKVKSVGVDILEDIVTKLRNTLPTRPLGFHFYTLNLEKVVSLVLERCNLIPPPDETAIIEDDEAGTIIVHGQRRDRRTSSLTVPDNRLVVDGLEGRGDSMLLETAKTAGFLQNNNQSEQRADVTLTISEGEGTLGREATWDDFPNGRFGDARSPAFGDIDGYGPSLHMSHSQAAKLWGFPAAPEDISALFVRHITGDLSAIPWSEQDLNEESKVIRDELVALNKKGWWTVASQPAVNCCRSDDATFGWGPTGGFVFQKAFVEFFCSTDDLVRLEGKLRQLGDVVSFYAANDAGEYRSNMPPSEESLNAVTWGVFTGKEIITPTIIEEVNFKAWKEEAFSIWYEWSRVYPPRSPTAQFLAGVARKYWLVNVIHHDFPEPAALWELLAGL